MVEYDDAPRVLQHLNFHDVLEQRPLSRKQPDEQLEDALGKVGVLVEQQVKENGDVGVLALRLEVAD